MGNEIMILLSPGVATMLISKSKAATVLRLGEVDQDDFDLQKKTRTSKIAVETRALDYKFLTYANIDKQNIFAFSETLLDIFQLI